MFGAEFDPSMKTAPNTIRQRKEAMEKVASNPLSITKPTTRLEDGDGDFAEPTTDGSTAQWTSSLVVRKRTGDGAGMAKGKKTRVEAEDVSPEQ
jgi:hypothetical protein